MFDTCFDRKHHACCERMFRVSCVVIEFIVVLQTRSLMADQTHSVYHKAKALAEFTLLLCPAPCFVDFSPRPTGNNCDTRLILNESNFLEKFLHQLSRLSHDRHPRHVPKIPSPIAPLTHTNTFSSIPSSV